MLYKMLLVERDYQLKLRDGIAIARPRQVFVTQSRVLASKVEEHFITYLASLAVASRMDYRGKSAQHPTNVNEADKMDLFNEEDVMSWRNDLPERFSELQDNHFPLFITFDRVRRCASSP